MITTTTTTVVLAEPTCKEATPKCCGLNKDGCAAKDGECAWDFLDKTKFADSWRGSCIPADCVGLNSDSCELHPKKCEWKWSNDWKTSCVEKATGQASMQKILSDASSEHQILSDSQRQSPALVSRINSMSIGGPMFLLAGAAVVALMFMALVIKKRSGSTRELVAASSGPATIELTGAHAVA